ncbi:hypothetical protein KZZ52_26720 [Dactylosporangium sp. AC04546]|uniref:hypothetical protein n=1 Tax=Dactylosporangium sp. AC04546 TaxID=2862460 RepID=UPI001EDD21FB|nr:hypothetical protein [Dactylosporangium sp. AC04546]WVK88862.1 hypothetical protein KZZ52_26720 [Dactylosporangium sp. AC04546]
MEFVLDPPNGVGPLRLGMAPDEARAALETLGPLESTAHGELAVHLTSGLGFSVGFGIGATRDQVNAIEVWRPHQRDVVLYRDVDVFGLPALVVVERLRRHIDLVPNDDDGFTARELYLTLWRPFAADDDPDETQGHFFQSVLVARPGYDDTPAEAAARLAAGDEPGY